MPSDVYLRHDPVGTPIALVLDSPHSGEVYPADFNHAPPRAIVRRAEDTHVARLWRAAPAVGATLLEAQFPRSYIDANRSLADIDTALLSDMWPEPLAPSRKTEQGIGLVWRLARGGTPMYAHKLSSAQVRARIDRYWQPYHRELATILDARHREHGAVWYIDCHSMPAVGDELADDPGVLRADFVLGDRDGTTCEPAFTAFVANAAREMGYSVAINDPYKGVELVRKHGKPAANRHGLQVELKRTLYMDENTLVPNTGYAKLEADLTQLLGAVAGYVRERT